MLTEALLVVILQTQPKLAFGLVGVAKTMADCEQVISEVPAGTAGKDKLMCLEVVVQNPDAKLEAPKPEQQRKPRAQVGKPGKDEV